MLNCPAPTGGKERGNVMKLQIFDGYDLQSLDCNENFSLTWVFVPVIRKGIEIRYISKDLYDFLNIPDWDDCVKAEERKLEKGIAQIMMLSDGERTVFLRSSEGLHYERDDALSERIVTMVREALSSGEQCPTAFLNDDLSEDEQLELIPKKQAKDILEILDSFQDTVFA